MNIASKTITSSYFYSLSSKKKKKNKSYFYSDRINSSHQARTLSNPRKIMTQTN